jgi:hypothetical protein
VPLPEQYGEGSGAETGGEKINPGVKKNRETDGESGVRVGVEAFRRDFYGGSVKSLLFFCIMVHCRGCAVARVLLCALGGGSGLKTLKFNTQ